jgi:hypothetical protein
MSGMGDLVLSDRPELTHIDSSDSDRFSVQGDEFDLKASTALMDHHDRSDITRFQAIFRKVSAQNYSV